MSRLSDAAIVRLRDLVERPDVATTRYEILERLGEGGMGVVYLARDRELGREVALKVLRAPDPSASERDRILREARILASLEHPGIAPVHDVGLLPDGRVFYVMKRIRGERLDSFARTPRSRAELLRVFRQVCDAVAFAHAAGVIHRDLKPQNVMLGAFGEVLVLDWGVAKLRGQVGESTAATTERSGEDADTAPGAAVGTPGYMAPEQLAGGSSAIDERADVFGLGGILCFLLTGDHPPAGLPSGTRWLAVPAPLRAICERARAAAPDMRYCSVSDLAADVANYLDALPVTAHREDLFERGRRLAARHRTALLLILAYLVMRVTLLVATGR
jgi:serine/threonine protein kinase